MSYLTPDLPSSNVTLSFTLPDTLLPVFMGALEGPYNPEDWEVLGSMGIVEACQYVEGWQYPTWGGGVDLVNGPSILDDANDLLADDTGDWLEME